MNRRFKIIITHLITIILIMSYFCSCKIETFPSKDNNQSMNEEIDEDEYKKLIKLLDSTEIEFIKKVYSLDMENKKYVLKDNLDNLEKKRLSDIHKKLNDLMVGIKLFGAFMFCLIAVPITYISYILLKHIFIRNTINKLNLAQNDIEFILSSDKKKIDNFFLFGICMISFGGALLEVENYLLIILVVLLTFTPILLVISNIYSRVAILFNDYRNKNYLKKHYNYKYIVMILLILEIIICFSVAFNYS